MSLSAIDSVGDAVAATPLVTVTTAGTSTGTTDGADLTAATTETIRPAVADERGESDMSK